MEELFSLLEGRCERRSMMVASNQACSKWYSILHHLMTAGAAIGPVVGIASPNALPRVMLVCPEGDAGIVSGLSMRGHLTPSF